MSEGRDVHFRACTLVRVQHRPDADKVVESQVTVLRDETEPGSEAQIDYGFLGRWMTASRAPGDGTRRSPPAACARHGAAGGSPGRSPFRAGF